MVRSWLRPPANCEERPAVRLPKMLLMLARKYHNPGRVCRCGNKWKMTPKELELSNSSLMPSKPSFLGDGQTRSSKGPSEFNQNNNEGNQDSGRTDQTIVHSTLNEQGNKYNQWADVKCQWHSSLDAIDKLLFLTSVVLWFAGIIASLVVVPAREGYFG